MNTFYAIITDKGLQNMAKAKADGENISLTHLAVGDSLGNYKEPQAQQENLYNELYRTSINRLEVDPDYQNQVIIEAVIPLEIGGFFIREVGIFDENGDLFAVAKYPATYKPTSDSGSSKDLYIRLTLAFANAANINVFENKKNALVSFDYLDNLANKNLSNVDKANINHQQCGNLQGGNEKERYHVNAIQYNLIQKFMTQDSIDNLAHKDLSNVNKNTISHQSWGNLQGGSNNERYHISAEQYRIVSNFASKVISANAGKELKISADGTGFSEIAPQSICQGQTTITGSDLIIDPNYSIYLINMTAARSLFINPVNVTKYQKIITIELRIVMSTVYSFSIQNQVKWLDGDTPTFNETGTHLIALRTYDNGATWVGSYQGKY